MIGILETIFETITSIGTVILWAAETLLNLIIDAANALFAAATTAGIFSLPSTFAPPTILGWLNWFFPVAAVLSVATGLATTYGAFLAVKWVFTKAGVIG